MSEADRVTMLVAGMLTGTTAPGDALVKQVIMLAKSIANKIAEASA